LNSSSGRHNANNRLTLKHIGLISASRYNYSNHDNDALSRNVQFSAQPPEEVQLTAFNLSLFFSSRFGTHGQLVMLCSSASIRCNLVAVNSIYNSTIGAYTFMPVN